MTTVPRASTTARLRPLAVKVPEITAIFWALKLLTTGMGESMSDFMGQHSVPIAGAVGLLGLALALTLQLSAREYRAPVYWFAVMMVAVFGTMAADAIHDAASIPYSVTTPVFALVVAVTFFLWHRSEGTLSIHSINTRRREGYYWTAVLATFALGTAAGDLTATSLKMGFFASAVLFAAAFAIPGLAWRQGRLGSVAAFWIAYVLTRPLGASFADWFSKPHSITGLGLGDGTVSGLALIVFVALVAYVTMTGRDRQRVPAAHWHPHLPHPPAAESPALQAQPAEN